MKDKHAWNTWDGYCGAHDGYIEHFKAGGFVLEDRMVGTPTPLGATWEGEVYCRDGIEIHVRKRQEVRRRRGRVEVHTVEYSYHVLLRLESGQIRDIFRYDNVHVHAHHADEHHRHRYTVTGRDALEHVGVLGWPTFSEVIKEAQQWWEANFTQDS